MFPRLLTNRGKARILETRTFTRFSSRQDAEYETWKVYQHPLNLLSMTERQVYEEEHITKPTTMRRLPQQARGEQRIAAILQAAAQVFYEVGFDAATTDMIAKLAHTAIGSLYDFFPNKEAIAQRLCEQFCEDLRVLFEGILTDELVQVLLPLAGYGPAIDSQIIVELKTMIRAYLQAVVGSESEM